jgi:aminoglycoside phosphotransferase (APT) family kinase protein
MWYSLTQAARAEAQDAGAATVDVSALSEMLTPAYPGQRVVAAELLSGGFANTNFKVSLSNMDAPVVVRVYVRDPSAAYREASILELVKERVPVPEVFYVSPEAREPHTYIILSWVGGVPLDQLLAEGASSDARRAVRATGSVLAKLQGFQFASSGFFGSTLEIRTPFASEARAIIGVLEQCLFRDCGEERIGVALTQRLWRFVTEHEESLRAVEDHSMLVHGDFSGPNVVLRTTPDPPEVAALIDWEYAHSGTPLVDLGSMLRRPGHELAPWFEEELIRGYRQDGGILPENWRQVSRIVDLVKLCAFIRSPNAGEVAVESVRALIESALTEEHQ